MTAVKYIAILALPALLERIERNINKEIMIDSLLNQTNQSTFISLLESEVLNVHIKKLINEFKIIPTVSKVSVRKCADIKIHFFH